MNRRVTLWLACAAVSIGSGCGGEEAPTYWQDVAPIYFENCVTCHQDGGIAPFSLDTYEAAREWAEPAALAASERTMPPWLVTDDGTCGEFHGSRVLSEDDIAVIEKWAREGAIEGEPRDDLRVPDVPRLDTGTDLLTPEFTPELQGGDLAAFDEYRCFVIDPQLERDMFMTGYDVIPGNDRLVHHVLVMPVDPDLDVGNGKTNREVMQELDDASPNRAGWPCYGAAGEGVEVAGIPITWAPGQGVTSLPDGVGARLKQSELLVVQMHDNLADEQIRGQSDQTTVRLQLTDTVEREGLFVVIDPFLDTVFTGQPATLEAGRASVIETWDVPGSLLTGFFGVEQLEIHGVFLHMHEFGRKMRVELISSAGEQCAADVQRWNFDWQLYYMYETPLILTGDEVLRATCDYNTEGRTEPVSAGWGTQNEMCAVGLLLVF